jgi:hypothetical protein
MSINPARILGIPWKSEDNFQHRFKKMIAKSIFSCEILETGYDFGRRASSVVRFFCNSEPFSAVEEEIVSALLMLEEVSSPDVDPIEEMRMRTWARRHYKPAEQRDGSWHPIVLDEMFRKDRESQIKPR